MVMTTVMAAMVMPMPVELVVSRLCGRDEGGGRHRKRQGNGSRFDEMHGFSPKGIRGVARAGHIGRHTSSPFGPTFAGGIGSQASLQLGHARRVERLEECDWAIFRRQSGFQLARRDLNLGAYADVPPFLPLNRRPSFLP
jgi:hypothetical protein